MYHPIMEWVIVFSVEAHAALLTWHQIFCQSVYIFTTLPSVLTKTTLQRMQKGHRSPLTQYLVLHETANAFWTPLQIIFGSHDFQKPQIELHPSEKQQSEWQNPQDAPAMWPGGREEVAFWCPCSKLRAALLYTLQKWMRIPALVYHGIQFMWASMLRQAGW